MALFGERIVSAKDMLDHYMDKAIPVLPAKIENSEQRFLLTCDQKLLQTWSEEFVTQIDEIINARAAFHVANNQILNAQQKAQHELDFTTLMSANDITLYLRRAGTKLNEIRTAQDKLDRLLRTPVNGNGSRRQVSLPQLSLKSFDGTSGTWDEFWPLFETTVDGDNDLNGVQKMSYLDAQLRGEAKKCIQGLFPYSDDNYRLAVDILKDKYGKSENIIRDLHNRLARLPKSDSLEEDLKLQVEVELICRQLEQYKQNLNSPQVYLNLEQKLSKKVLSKYVDLKSSRPVGAEWTTECFRRTFKYAVEHLKQIKDIQTRSGQYQGHESRKNLYERIQTDPPDEPLSSTMNLALRNQQAHKSSPNQDSKSVYIDQPMETPSKNPMRSDSPWPPESRLQAGKTTTTRTPSSSRSRSPARFPCQMCKGIHFAMDCDSYRTIGERRKVIEKLGLCFVCLNPGHQSKDCKRYLEKCFNCKRPKHHPAICEKRYIGKKVQVTSTRMIMERKEFKATDDALTSTTGCVKDQTEEHSLLKCVEVQVYNPLKPEKLRKCIVAFLDCGSEKSYMKASLIEDLQLNSLSERKKVSISGIGGKEIGIYETGFYEVGMKGKSIEILMKVRELNRILSKVPRIDYDHQSIEELMSNKIRLSPKLQEPELLIGGDYYDQMGIVPIEQLQNGFWISSSKLGMLISGEGRIEDFDRRLASNQSNSKSIIHTNSLTCQMLESIYSQTKFSALTLKRIIEFSQEAIKIDLNELVEKQNSLENIADRASRGRIPCELNENPLWLKVPEWLELDSIQWPEGIRNFDADKQAPPEQSNQIIEKIMATIEPNASIVTPLFNYENFWQFRRLYECEQIINGRPLSFLSEDEVIRPLRPINLITTALALNNPNIASVDYDPNDTDYVETRSRKDKRTEQYNMVQMISNNLWKQFKEPYLLTLRERQHGNKGKNDANFLQIGVIVLVSDSNEFPRTNWRLGKIEEIRSTKKVKLTMGNKIFEHGVKIIYHLESANQLAIQSAPLSAENEEHVKVDQDTKAIKLFEKGSVADCDIFWQQLMNLFKKGSVADCDNFWH